MYRQGHGTGKGKPRIEIMDADQLPQPIPATLPEPGEEVVRRPDGRVADSEAAKRLGAKGGLAKAKKRQALKGLGLHKLTDTDEFHPYWKMSEEYIQEKLQDLAMQAGGYVGPGPASMVVSAGRFYAASLYYFDMAAKQGGAPSASLMQQASRFAETSRIQNMAAYEMAIREAKSRAQHKEMNAYASLIQAAADGSPNPDDE